MPQIIDSIEIDRILLKIHVLLISFDHTNPDLVINNQTDQMIVRYIKNLVNEIVQLKREGIVQDYIKSVEQHTVKDKYIKRWIRNILSSLSKKEETLGNIDTIVNDNNISMNDYITAREVKFEDNKRASQNIQISRIF